MRVLTPPASMWRMSARFASGSSERSARLASGGTAMTDADRSTGATGVVFKAGLLRDRTATLSFRGAGENRSGDLAPMAEHEPGEEHHDDVAHGVGGRDESDPEVQHLRRDRHLGDPARGGGKQA